MTKSYIIVPLILLGIFGFLHRNFVAEDTIRQAEEAAEVAAMEAEAAAKKAEAEARAAAEAAQRTAEREAAEAKKIADRDAKWEAQGAEIARYTAEAKAESDKHQAKINQLELNLADKRKTREALSKETFEMMKNVEAARIAVRNAELQVQRMAQMVTRKAETSVLVKAPILPPDTKKR